MTLHPTATTAVVTDTTPVHSSARFTRCRRERIFFCTGSRYSTKKASSAAKASSWGMPRLVHLCRYACSRVPSRKAAHASLHAPVVNWQLYACSHCCSTLLSANVHNKMGGVERACSVRTLSAVQMVRGSALRAARHLMFSRHLSPPRRIMATAKQTAVSARSSPPQCV